LQGAFEFHVREVQSPPPNFTVLAENNGIMLSTSNAIVGIQAHPEMNGKIAKTILDANDSTYVTKYSSTEIQNMKERCNDKHDGLVIIERILAWVRE
jgi:GMP synthase-like glutamine amidotransferase